jgi:hypothetical protein
MSKGDEPAPEPSDDDMIADEMQLWERWVALVLGVLLAGPGVWAVFASSNQAGSAVLLLIGAALLLIGVQGTPLIKIGGSTANLELERRRRRTQKAIEQADTEPNPDVAHGMIEAAAIMEPNLVLSTGTQARLYLDRLAAALKTIFEDEDVERETPPDRYDFVISTLMGRTVIEAKYKPVGSFRAWDVWAVARRFRGKVDKLVVATNAPLTEETRSINAAGICNGVPVEVVTWNDTAHNDLLHRAILRGASS